MANQPITALPDYFNSMSACISGFPEAMSLISEDTSRLVRIALPGMITAYIAVALLILVAIWHGRSNSAAHSIVMMSCVGLFLLLAFKAGFVRHDKHASAAGSALVFAALALNIRKLSRVSLWTSSFAIIVWALIHVFYMGLSINSSPIVSLYGVMKGDRFGEKLETAFIRRLDKIHSEEPIPRLDGTTDIYPYDIASLIASRNNWLPRPVPQSYSAYTATLARINEAHLRGNCAPDNIVFRVATIDRRLPSLDDGLSWPTILSHYTISTTDRHYAYLKKRQTPSESIETLVMQGSYKLGEHVILPKDERILLAEIDVTPSLLGRIATVIFKSPQLYITVIQESGDVGTYRFIPNMARTSFVISPLINTTEEFVQITNGELPPALFSKTVRSIRIAPSGAKSFWAKSYLLRVSVFEMKS